MKSCAFSAIKLWTVKTIYFHTVLYGSQQTGGWLGINVLGLDFHSKRLVFYMLLYDEINALGQRKTYKLLPPSICFHRVRRYMTEGIRARVFCRQVWISALTASHPSYMICDSEKDMRLSQAHVFLTVIDIHGTLATTLSAYFSYI